MTTQASFDFGRGDQLAILNAARLDSVAVGSDAARDRVRGSTLRHVLRVLDDCGRGLECFPSIDTIAERTGLGARTVKRAIAALQARSLLVVELKRSRFGVVCNHYRIVWSELALLAQPETPNGGPASSSDGPVRHYATRSDGPVMPTDGPVRPSDGPVMPTDGPVRPPIRLETRIDNPPNDPREAAEEVDRLAETWSASDRISAIAALESEGLRTATAVVEEAIRRRLTAAELLAIVATFRANRRRLRGPGAIVERIRSGAWPAEIPREATPEELAAREEELAERRRNAVAERIRYSTIRSGRSLGLTEAEIEKRLAAAFAAAGLQVADVWGG